MYLSVLGRELSVIAIGYIFIYRVLSGRSLRTAIKEIIIPLIFAIGGLATTHLLIPNPGYAAYYYPALLNSFKIEKILKELYQIIATYHIGWIPILITLSLSARKNYDPLILTSILVGGGFIILDHFIGMISSRFVFLTYPGFLIALQRGIENMARPASPRVRFKIHRIVAWIFILSYIIVGFAETAQNNISLPTSSDAGIAKLFPEGYPQEELWQTNK